MITLDEHPGFRAGRPVRPGIAGSPLQKLLDISLVEPEDLDRLGASERDALDRCTDATELTRLLVRSGLLTDFQADRVRIGAAAGLILGNYRLLERLGGGGMGEVFKAEHRRMRRLVAIKVLPIVAGQDDRALRRFFTEIRAVAQLQHPNIVAALDAGELPAGPLSVQQIHYLVMEYVPGQDLSEYVAARGPMSVVQACGVAHQIAAALAEAHRHGLIHRDIKPSNIRLALDGRAKLLDFGLARNFDTRITRPGAVLGTISYMAPEQARDATTVDIRADLYGLGGTLFWCLTGREPFPTVDNPLMALMQRQSQPPPSPRQLRPGLSDDLDALTVRLLATDPADRFQTPDAVMTALLPFLTPATRDPVVPLAAVPAGHLGRRHRVLIVDDEPLIRQMCQFALEFEEIDCEQVPDGLAALAAVGAGPFDLVLLDIDMPGMSGVDVCRRLREDTAYSHLKIIMMSGRATADEMALMLSTGCDDYLPKPLSVVQLQSRVKAALRLRDAHQRSDLLNRHLLAVNAEMERTLGARDSDLVQARNALVLALAKLVEHRDNETGAHLMRLQRYSRCLAEEAMRTPAYADQIDATFVDMLECCAPLHDIGKVALPDHILLKPGKLDPAERIMMQTHTVIGADTLTTVAEQHGFAVAFLQMAADIARHHHERYDGAGYPDRLAGTDIPLPARLVSIGDVYDALRSRRSYKPSFSHADTLDMMTGNTGQFDPGLFQVFQRCADKFNQIFHDHAE